MPQIELHSDPEWSSQNHSFGRYTPETHTLEVSLANRHVMDILRTTAHELVHCRQNQDQQLPDEAGETGSNWENQAHAVAGVIMRDWADRNPAMFESSGYIPTEAERNDPRFLMALTQDVRPGATGLNANRMRLKTDAQGRPQLLRANGKVNMVEYRLPQPSKGPNNNKDLNAPLGPETPPKMPAGTIKVDVSDMYDWYKLGQKISDLKSIDKSDLGVGPPSTVFAFGSEDLENMYSHQLTNLGLKTHDLDEPGEEDVDEGSTSNHPGKPVVDAIQKVMPVVQEIWFHGSRATGRHRKNSDTDILVVVPDDLVGDQYLGAVRILQKLSAQFDNYDIQPTKLGTNIHRIAQEEGRLLWANKQGVAEGFDQPYPLKWEKSDYGDMDALAKLPDGSPLSIMFNLADMSENDWGVEFYRNNSQSVTGEGDAQRVFATVLTAIGQFIKKQKPDTLFFTAVKEEDPTGSRTKLYDRLVQRYATGLGYNLQKVEYPEQTGYKLTRKEQGVAENFADGRNPQDKGDAKRHGINTKASVSSLRKTAKSGGRKGQLAHWLANMKSGRAKARRKNESLDEVRINNSSGVGAVPHNADVDYFGLQVQMRPSMFLKLALPMDPHDPEERKAVEFCKGELNERGIGAPFLNVSVPEAWEQGDFSLEARVKGHDGRHRCYAILEKEGDDAIEMHIFIAYTRRRDITDEMIENLRNGILNQLGQFVRGPIFGEAK
jgi:predicted nucleotidyltransferase